MNFVMEVLFNKYLVTSATLLGGIKVFDASAVLFNISYTPPMLSCSIAVCTFFNFKNFLKKLLFIFTPHLFLTK